MAEDRTVRLRLSYFLGDLQDTESFGERVSSCDTENRTFELRGEFNRKKAQIPLRRLFLSMQRAGTRDRCESYSAAIKIFM